MVNFQISEKRVNLRPNFEDAGVMELVDMLDLGSSAARRGGSSPFTRTLSQSD